MSHQLICINYCRSRKTLESMLNVYPTISQIQCFCMSLYSTSLLAFAASEAHLLPLMVYMDLLSGILSAFMGVSQKSPPQPLPILFSQTHFFVAGCTTFIGEWNGPLDLKCPHSDCARRRPFRDAVSVLRHAKKHGHTASVFK